MRIVHFAGTLVLLSGLFFGHLNNAAAQGSDAVRQACTPDVPRVTACMKAKSSQLSDACRVAMRGEGGGKRTRRYHGHYHHYHHHHH
jgi:hypothetical protein